MDHETTHPNAIQARLDAQDALADLRRRAERAFQYAIDAGDVGNADKFARSVERMVQRWDQIDEIGSSAWARREMAGQRLDQMRTIFGYLEEDAAEIRDALVQRMQAEEAIAVASENVRRGRLSVAGRPP